MQILVTHRESWLDPADAAHVTQSVRLALSRYAPRIRSITAVLTEDANHLPAGNIACRLRVRLVSSHLLEVEQDGESAGQAAARAASSAARQLARLLAKSRRLTAPGPPASAIAPAPPGLAKPPRLPPRQVTKPTE